MAQTLGQPGFSAVSTRRGAEVAGDSIPLADIPKKPDQVWAVLDDKQRDDGWRPRWEGLLTVRAADAR